MRKFRTKTNSLWLNLRMHRGIIHGDIIMEQQYPRLDRIEKNLEILLQGISELRDAQAKTDEQLKRTDKKLETVTKQLGDMGLVVKDEVGRYAEEAGLFVLTQTNEGGATLWNREDFTPKEFQ